MPPLRGRTRKVPITDISDSSSQASEDNTPLTKVDPKANRVMLHYAAENPDKPNAGMNGPYGMFSQCSPPSARAPLRTVAKRKRATMDRRQDGDGRKETANIITSKKRAVMKDISGEREDSPLFESEDGWQEDARLTPASNIHSPLLSRRKTSQGITVPKAHGHVNRGILIESGSSSSDSESDAGSSIIVPTQHLFTHLPLPKPIPHTDKNTSPRKTASPTPSKRTRPIATLAKQQTAISLALARLRDEETQRLAVIAQSCAKGIQTDMADPRIATNMITIQAAIGRRNGGAEMASQGVREAMAKRREELEAEALEVRSKREALENVEGGIGGVE